MLTSVSTLPRDPREAVTRKEFQELKHRTHTAERVIRATEDAVRFYTGERNHIISSGAKDLGRDGNGTLKDVGYFNILIYKNKEDLKLYRAEYWVLHQRMVEVKPFIQAKDWIRDWRR